MQNKRWDVGLALLLSITVGACSSSMKEEEDPFTEEFAGAEASMDEIPTDAIPTEELPPDDSMARSDVPLEDPEPLEAQPSALLEPPLEESVPPPAPVYEEPAPQAAAPSMYDAGSEGEYRVQSGDTLMKIAFETYGNVYHWREIHDANRDRIQDPNLIPVGTMIRLRKPAEAVQIARNGERYRIRRGDTLGTISRDVYGTPGKWRRLWENNRQMIKDPDLIFAGFFLYYTMTPEDIREAEQLKNQNELAPNPLAATDQPLDPPSDMSGMPETESARFPSASPEGNL